ncbi:MAG: hypothetical protein WBP11_13890 [Dokdonella sp.]
MKRTTLLCLGALAFSSSLPLLAQTGAQDEPQEANVNTITQEQVRSVEDVPTLYRMAETYQDSGDMQRMSWTLEQMARVTPMDGDIQLALAASYSNLDEKSKAYDTLLRMQTQGFGYNLTKDERFKKVSDTEVWDYALANLRANLKPFGEGKVAFTLPKGEYLFESMAWDPKREKFLLGSVREGKVYLADKQGKIEEFIVPDAVNGLWSIYALAVDTKRDLLYVTSTASEYFKGFKADDVGKAGLFKFQLSSGKFLDKVILPAAADGNNTLSSLAVGKNGQVFAVDGIRSIMYRLDGKTLKPLMHNPNLKSLRGMAVSGDGKTLYFSDYTRGIFGVDLTTSKAFDIKYDLSQLVLPGIEGLFWYDNTLIAIEPGMSPKRVIRLHLSADGRKVERVMPLDAGNPALVFPTTGTIVDDALYFFADSHRAFYDSYGVPKNESAASPQHVFRSNLRFAWKETMERPALGEKPIGGPQIIGPGQFKGDPRSLFRKVGKDFGTVTDQNNTPEPSGKK